MVGVVGAVDWQSEAGVLADDPVHVRDRKLILSKDGNCADDLD